MASEEPSPGQADTAQTASRNHVVVTGAGFSRALVPGAPLLIDDFNNDALEEKVRGLPNASRLPEWERSVHSSGHINLERLMTRLDSLMPYDYAENAGNAANEYEFLLSELKRAFLDRLHEARKGDIHHDELKRFAEYCVALKCCCITFNYDDFLDEALAQTYSWSPDRGYGFFCQSSQEVVASTEAQTTASMLLLLKLHGSINWRPKPYPFATLGQRTLKNPPRTRSRGRRPCRREGRAHPRPLRLCPSRRRSVPPAGRASRRFGTLTAGATCPEARDPSTPNHDTDDRKGRRPDGVQRVRLRAAN